jgi:two-component system OmpR family response regulator
VDQVTDYVLVVDDDAGIRSMVTMALESEGYLVTTASNGAEALHEIARDRPSVMLLDVQMPVLDGSGVTGRLRELGERVPTVVMTGAGNAPRWAADLGADACLSKPFELDELLLTVKDIGSR